MQTKNIKMKTTRCHSLMKDSEESIRYSLTNGSEEIRNLNQMPYLAHAQGMTNEYSF